jgi:hypothetical protein
VSDIVLDSTEIATDTIDYVPIDPAGLTSTSMRKVPIEALSPPAVTGNRILNTRGDRVFDRKLGVNS